LGEAAKPSRVILFGSYARGDAQEDSDLDFLVVEPTLQDKFCEMVRLRQVLRPLRVPADVLVCSQADLNQQQDSCPTAVYWAFVKVRCYMMWQLEYSPCAPPKRVTNKR